MEEPVQLDADPDPSIRSRFKIVIVVILMSGIFFAGSLDTGSGASAASQGVYPAEARPGFSGVGAIVHYFPVYFTIGLLCLIALSAFFSASEVAFFSIHRIRLRAMADGGGTTGPLVSAMMNHPGRLLTTILVGNMLVNVLISVLLPRRVQLAIDDALAWPESATYAVTVLVCTAFLVFFGEISPKVTVVRIGEAYARAVVIPLKAIDWILGPLCQALIGFTDFIFKITRFNNIKAAPFITDEEFKSVISNSEAQGVIEEEEGQMIQGILEFGDTLLREILVPRPDVAALSEQATVGEALELYRAREFSRMPVYKDDLDHVTGMLFAKDLLPNIAAGEHDRPVSTLTRKPYFVPETMTIRGFVKDAQRMRTHLAIVVDEYGGTEGIVTLEDAIEEVVGEIRDEDEVENRLYERLDATSLRVDGNLPLDVLSELIGTPIEDDEHETVAGFVMNQANKVLESGDRIEHSGVVFIVEKTDGKRVASLLINLGGKVKQEGSAS